MAQCWSIVKFDSRGVLKSVPFLIMLLMSIMNFFANVMMGGERFDSIPYPLTGLMLNELSGGFNNLLAVILVFYAGELIFKERQAKIADVVDAMPVPNWAPLLAKCFALITVILVFLFVGVLCAIAIQLFKGGAPIEGLLYLKGGLLTAMYFILIALAALSLQVLTNNKFIGYLLAIVLLVSDGVMHSMSLDHRLYNFASLPTPYYSDMNGYGHFIKGWSWFALYWSLFSVALLILAQAFSQRGLAQGWRMRLRLAIRNLKGSAGFGLALCLLSFAGTGAWIFYNTNVLNHYVASDNALDLQADYEKLYARYENLPHPKITDIRADVEIYPEQRRVVITGHYVLQNKTAAPLDTLRIQNAARVTTSWQNLPAHQVILNDKTHGFSILKLSQPVAPGASLALDFTVMVNNPGFTNSGKPTEVQLNGSFFTDSDFFPKFGYNKQLELEGNNQRRQHGLAPAAPIAKLEDKAARARNFYNIEADWINFDTTVSTSLDQIAMAPGYLQKTWVQGGRRYFHYKMDRPMVPFFTYLSARYEVKKAEWQGLPIEIYYDKKHPYNLDNMIAGTQDALSYFTQAVWPISAPASAHSGISQLCLSRAILRQYHPVFGVTRFYQ